MGSTKTTLSEKIQAFGPVKSLGMLRVAKARYNFAVDGGAQGAIIPKTTTLLPANTVIVGATINSTTAFLSGGSATLSVGTSAGSSATSILGATAKASLSANAVLNGVPVFATPVKLTAKGYLNVTIGTADATAGIVEVTVYYYVANV